MTKNFLTEKEMAERLRVSVAWLRKRRQIGGGPTFVKFGDWMVRYPSDSADEFESGLTRMQSTSMAK